MPWKTPTDSYGGVRGDGGLNANTHKVLRILEDGKNPAGSSTDLTLTDDTSISWLNDWTDSGQGALDDGGELDVHQSREAQQQGPHPTEHHVKEERKQAAWRNVREDLARALIGCEGNTCDHGKQLGRDKCKPRGWKGPVYGVEGDMRSHKEVVVAYRFPCESLGAVLINHGLFPSAPLEPRCAFSLDWLELYHDILMRTGAPNDAMSTVISRFMRKNSTENIDNLKRRFIEAYFGWLPVQDLARELLWRQLNEDMRDVGGPGTLEGTCPSCFFRPASDSEIWDVLDVPMNHPCRGRTRLGAPESRRSGSVGRGTGVIDDASHVRDGRRSADKDIEEIRWIDAYFVGLDGCVSYKSKVELMGRFEEKDTAMRAVYNKNIHNEDWGYSMARTDSVRPELLAGNPRGPNDKPAYHWGTKDLSSYNRTDENIEQPTSTEKASQMLNAASRNRHQGMNSASSSSRMFTDEIYSGHVERTGCPHAFAADVGNKSESTSKHHQKPDSLQRFDETGLFGLICRHDVPIRLGDIWRGENFDTAFIVLTNFLSAIPENTQVVLSYDLACKFWPWIRKHHPEVEDRLRMTVNAFHTYAHQFQCQIQWGPLFAKGVGRTDGEGVERFWSVSAHLVKLCQLLGKLKRHQLIHAHNVHIADERRRDIGRFLEARYTRIMRELARDEAELLRYAKTWLDLHPGRGIDNFEEQLERQMDENRAKFLNPSQTIAKLVKGMHTRYPYRAIFHELCFLQPEKNKKTMWDPQKFQWKNITKDDILTCSPASPLVPLVNGALFEPMDGLLGPAIHFDPTQWQRGSDAWRYYYGEICVKHLQDLYQQIRSHFDSRRNEYRRIRDQTLLHKVRTKLFATINGREKGLANHVSTYNAFLNHAVRECGEYFASERWQPVTEDDFKYATMEANGGSKLWDHEKHVIQTWVPSFDWGWEPDQVRAATICHRIKRSKEELQLLSVEMLRAMALAVVLIRRISIPNSPLIARRQRNWQQIVNDIRDMVGNIVQHAPGLGLETQAGRLHGESIISFRMLSTPNK